MATCHAPQLFTYPPDEDSAQLDASIAGMREIGKLLDETEPDVIIFLGSDHLETFSIGCVPTFAIVAGNRAKAEFAGRNYDLPIHREMAEDLLGQLVRADFDLAYSEDAVLGHTFAVPFEFVIGGRDIPVIPIHTNVYMPPLPSPKRCAALGRAIAEVIASRTERVAIIASGGMSHYPGTWKYPHPEFEFDKWMISELEQGKVETLFNLTSEQLDEVGNTELLPWAVLLGAIGAVPSPPAAAPPAYVFKDEGGFKFYVHPPAEAYHLNKLLFDMRHDAALRRRLLTDFDSVTKEYQLREDCLDAARALAEVGTTAKISDNAGRIVAAGAHPMHALMTLHAEHGEMKRLQRELAEEKRS
jgi:protocatechuate 4,5-dioxygenase beta chain/2,3-dihydroxyphenylpropionate 1,2-dioxygenase